MKIFSTIGLLLTSLLTAFAQTDSLRAELGKSRPDTARVKLYYAYGDALVQDAPDSAVWYFNKARAVAERINYRRGIADFSSHYIVVLNNRGAFREALGVAREALELYKQFGTKRELAVAYLNVGSEWQYLSDFALAADNYLLAKKMAEETGDKRLQRIANNNLASVFIELKEYEKGRQYAERSLQIARELNNTYAVSSSTYNIATADMHLGRYQQALALYRQIRTMGEQTDDDVLQLDGWLGMADALSAMRQTADAGRYYNKVIQFSRSRDMPEYEMYACMGMADLNLKTNQFAAAAPFIDAGIGIAERLGSKLELKDLYLKNAERFEQMQQPQQALFFRKKFEALNDSLLGEKNRATVANLEARYGFERKEATISNLQVANRLNALTIDRKNTLNYVLVAGAGLLLVILLLLYRTNRQKQKIQKQRIAKLEREQQLAAAEAMLLGEEQERTRLAKDLHDGLGGMLSGIKFGFNTLRENLKIPAAQAQAFERNMDMLDSSIREMRRVAHNMMPEALLKFGLDAALRDCCNDVNESGALRVTYQSIGLGAVRLEQTKAIAIYRIVQELLNNIMKHAGAANAIVQVSAGDGLLSVTVEDDGKGFNPAILKQTGGIGWLNIQSRIGFLKGRWDVAAAPGAGASIHIEIEIHA